MELLRGRSGNRAGSFAGGVEGILLVHMVSRSAPHWVARIRDASVSNAAGSLPVPRPLNHVLFSCVRVMIIIPRCSWSGSHQAVLGI